MTKSLKSSLVRRAKRVGALAASAALAACAQTAGPNGLYKTPIGNAPVTTNPTPYTAGLVCLGQYARSSGNAGQCAGRADRDSRLAAGRDHLPRCAASRAHKEE